MARGDWLLACLDEVELALDPAESRPLREIVRKVEEPLPPHTVRATLGVLVKAGRATREGPFGAWQEWRYRRTEKAA